MVVDRVPEGAIPQPVIELCTRLREAGHDAWVVGGSVRDLLMGRSPKDWDLATSARPEQVQKIFERVIPTGIDHGTVTVLWSSERYEVTTLRGEGAYTDGRHPDSVFFVDDIEKDLSRRDFTVNALAYHVHTDRLIDPFSGLRDMQNRKLRTVGDPSKRFGEDGLRVLRAARFTATLDFDLSAETRDAIGGALSSFEKVSVERVREEWLKTMGAERPSRAFHVMRETGILNVTCPQLTQQHGCTQNSYHAYDVWTHSMLCMDACSLDPIHRIAALLHDLGKPATRAMSDKTGDYTFYNHENVGAEMADDWLETYRFSREDRGRIVHLVRHHLVCYSDGWSDAAVRRFIKRVGLDNLEDLLHLAAADCRAKGRPVEEELAGLERLRARSVQVRQSGAAFGVRDLKISGNDLIRHLNVPPGPVIGSVLEKLLQRVLDDPGLNERQRLLSMAAQLHEEEP